MSGKLSDNHPTYNADYRLSSKLRIREKLVKVHLFSFRNRRLVHTDGLKVPVSFSLYFSNIPCISPYTNMYYIQRPYISGRSDLINVKKQIVPTTNRHIKKSKSVFCFIAFYFFGNFSVKKKKKHIVQTKTKHVLRPTQHEADTSEK